MKMENDENIMRCAKMNTSAVHVASQFQNESEINSRGLNISISKCISYSLVDNTTNSSFDLLSCYLLFIRIYFWRNYFRNDANASQITIQLKLKSVEQFSSGRISMSEVEKIYEWWIRALRYIILVLKMLCFVKSNSPDDMFWVQSAQALSFDRFSNSFYSNSFSEFVVSSVHFTGKILRKSTAFFVCRE